MKTEDKLDLFGKEVSYNDFDENSYYSPKVFGVTVCGVWEIRYGSYSVHVYKSACDNILIQVFCNLDIFNTDKIPKPKNVDDMNKISADATPKQIQQRVATILNWCIKNRERENEKAMEWAANKADWW